MLFILCTLSLIFVSLPHKPPQTLRHLLSCRVGPVRAKALNQMTTSAADPKGWWRHCFGIAARVGYVGTSPTCVSVLWSAYQVEATSIHTPTICCLLIYAHIRNCRYVDNQIMVLQRTCSLPWKCH